MRHGAVETCCSELMLIKVLYCKCLKNTFLAVIAMIVTRDVLVSIRRVAMRKRVWFSVLGRLV